MEYGLDDGSFDGLTLLACPRAHHIYWRVLLTFRAYGRRERRAVWAPKLALDNNSEVPDYLLARSATIGHANLCRTPLGKGALGFVREAQYVCDR